MRIASCVMLEAIRRGTTATFGKDRDTRWHGALGETMGGRQMSAGELMNRNGY